MKSSIDVLSALYQLLNVPSVTSVINGKVLIGNPPDGDQNENISLNTLANKNAYLQQGFANINIHMPELSSGRSYLERFKTLVDIIVPLVEDTSKNDIYFQIDDDKGIFKDDDRDSMYFYNIRLTFQTL